MINFLCGALAGVFTGLGAGGGLFLIAILNWTSGFSQLEIQTINLVYYIVSATFAIFIYSKENSVDFKIGIKLIIISIITAIVGAKIANIIDVTLLRKLFSIYLIGTGTIFLASQIKERSFSFIWLKKK